ncbi:metallophosphoesterase [Variovorax sp. J22R115]|uniref:metallophosphoesterase n=1 Tax=Variovorax sp. J22R115 TaxID=3053509 RepID=UPI002578B9D4|nr:metallophosphoesterase [Variovorax sp. J22R115]MDM0047941.1 metallophosphoesterase [Variovorax sp. J22R115]
MQNRLKPREARVIPHLRFDQLYVVSDLHFGGDVGFQIFGSTDAMVWLIGELGRRDPAQQVALLINGDFIDFLAESDPRHFDPFGAITKLERIAQTDPTFEPIFAALRAFLDLPNRHLIVNLGNHDLELALPWVRRRLAELLVGEAPEDGDATRRLHLVTDGTGVSCTVGGRSVLCVHGNEVDRWNPSDFERIREIGRDVQLGRPVESWIPNAGTQMVIDVMNGVKRTFPFVDLLKPEKEGVVPVLAACDPSQLASLDRVAGLVGVAGNRLSAALRKPRGMLGEEAASAPLSASSSPLAGAFSRRDARVVANQMMLAVEEAVRRDIDPLEMVEGLEASQLGMAGALWKWINDQPTEEVLREALDKLDRDRSFDTRDYDDTAKALDREISPVIDFVVAGHTHLERALPRRNGGGVYFNSGTWARLIRIVPKVRQDAAGFARLFKVLQHGDMSKLDAEPGLVLRPNSVVAIRAEAAAGAAKGQLFHIAAIPSAPKTPTAYQWEAVPDTEFVRAG